MADATREIIDAAAVEPSEYELVLGEIVVQNSEILTETATIRQILH